MSRQKPAASIAILAYDGVQSAAVLGLRDLFLIANRGVAIGAPFLFVREIAEAQLAGDEARRAEDALDVVILPPNISGRRGAEASRLHQWLRAQHDAGAVLCSACAGAFLLGHSGLLEGRAATTHWALATEFAATFPATTLQAEQLLIDDHDIITAGGMMAWVDLGLHIVGRWLGRQAVSDTARMLLVDIAGREQRHFRSFRPPLKHGDAPVLKLQHWLKAHSSRDIEVPEMAARLGLSVRTLLRRFKAATGYSPNAYLQALRIEKARGMLERTLMPFETITADVGYRDVSAFGRLFRETLGLTPGEYRRRFGLGAVGAEIER
ncbi:MAG: helix-turn-helix domain-containing protein [Neomegalonema sp.]|nr:helix-turn-helix domain-containing protein [Neomegalonema sp.]